ncbi:alpha-ribazole phosphatase family protein [Pseudofulvibacter geojedonensis]|uniref:Alpha-ribazole phosphatase family protein n=1 Tax=Pseudofulvibacter geojedonensis TaxID=1123758 RepID=A0ABW3HZV4_9FLAO
MEIYLIRHTTPKIDSGICYGQSDLDLINNYAEEISRVTSSIQTIKPEIYSSPLKRCTILAKSFNENIVLDSNLKEINFGDWELKAWNDIDSEELNIWMKNFVFEKPPNGESYIELSKRVNESFDRIVTLSDSNKIIITHAGVIRAIIARLNNIDLKDSFKIKLEYGHIIKIVKDSSGLKIKEGLTIAECNS